MTSGSLQLCFEIVHNILIMPEFIQPCFKCVSSISRHNPVRQTISYIHHPIRKAKLSQIIFYTRLKVSYHFL